MNSNQKYSTLFEAVNKLQKKGYVKDDILDLMDQTNDPNKFKIVEYHRFEGCSNPSDNAVIYAIEADSGEKGLVIDAYGSDSDMNKTELLSKIKIADV